MDGGMRSAVCRAPAPSSQSARETKKLEPRDEVQEMRRKALRAANVCSEHLVGPGGLLFGNKLDLLVTPRTCWENS